MPVSCPANQIIPTVSVVMPCYQAAKYVRAALQSLVSQVSTVAYEIIVVDSSTDGSDRIVEEFPQVRLLHFPYRCQVGTAREYRRGSGAGRSGFCLSTLIRCRFRRGCNRCRRRFSRGGRMPWAGR